MVKFFEGEPNKGKKEKGEGNESGTEIEPPKAQESTDRKDGKKETMKKKEREKEKNVKRIDKWWLERKAIIEGRNENKRRKDMTGNNEREKREPANKRKEKEKTEYEKTKREPGNKSKKKEEREYKRIEQ